MPHKDVTEKRREYHKKWYAANREKHCEYNKKWRAANPEKRQAYNLRYRYDLTPSEYIAKLKKQNHCCMICGRHESISNIKLYVDHDHSTNKVRDLLCRRCNAELAITESGRHLKHLDYLARHTA